MDRGFLFGDGVYEVIPAFNKRPLAAEEHIARLDKSLDAIGMTNPLSLTEWQSIFAQLSEASTAQHFSIYLQVTRGAYEIRNHQVPDEVNPTLFVTTFPLSLQNPLHKGIKVSTEEDVRWGKCHIKAITLLANILAKKDAKQKNNIDAIFIKDGYAVEGTSSNLFIVKQNHVYTPPLTANILHGITRQLVLSLLKENNIPCTERMISLDELYKADEVWFTNSTGGIMPIIEIDGQQISNGQAGPLWHIAFKLYEKLL